VRRPSSADKQPLNAHRIAIDGGCEQTIDLQLGSIFESPSQTPIIDRGWLALVTRLFTVGFV
jgi:hypothetical protein